MKDLKKDKELCLHGDTKEIEKRFEPCTNCKKCHFYIKSDYITLPSVCALWNKQIEKNQTGCLGGYKIKGGK